MSDTYYLRAGRGAGKTHQALSALTEVIVQTDRRDGLLDKASDREYGIFAPTQQQAWRLLESLVDERLLHSWRYGFSFPPSNRDEGTGTIFSPSGEQTVTFYAYGLDTAHRAAGRKFTTVLCDDVSTEPDRWEALFDSDFYRYTLRAVPAVELITGRPWGTRLDFALQKRAIVLNSSLANRGNRQIVVKLEPTVKISWGEPSQTPGTPR